MWRQAVTDQKRLEKFWSLRRVASKNLAQQTFEHSSSGSKNFFVYCHGVYFYFRLILLSFILLTANWLPFNYAETPSRLILNIQREFNPIVILFVSRLRWPFIWSTQTMKYLTDEKYIYTSIYVKMSVRAGIGAMWPRFQQRFHDIKSWTLWLRWPT